MLLIEPFLGLREEMLSFCLKLIEEFTNLSKSTLTVGA